LQEYLLTSDDILFAENDGTRLVRYGFRDRGADIPQIGTRRYPDQRCKFNQQNNEDAPAPPGRKSLLSVFIRRVHFVDILDWFKIIPGIFSCNDL
jgi:hypothetical protein